MSRTYSYAVEMSKLSNIRGKELEGTLKLESSAEEACGIILKTMVLTDNMQLMVSVV